MSAPQTAFSVSVKPLPMLQIASVLVSQVQHPNQDYSTVYLHFWHYRYLTRPHVVDCVIFIVIFHSIAYESRPTLLIKNANYIVTDI